MTQLKLAETPTQTDLLDNFIEVFNQTNERLQDIPNAISIGRWVTPDEGGFSKVKTAINALLDINLKKQRKSQNLVETLQEIFLVPDTEEDAVRIATLLNYPRVTCKYLENLDKKILDSLFSNSSTFQTCWFAGVRTKEVTELNSINKFVTSSRIESQTTWIFENTRNACLFEEGYGVFRKLSYETNNMQFRSGSRSFPQADYSNAVKTIFGYECEWCEETKVVTDYREDPVSYEWVAERIRSSLDDLKTVNDRLDAYIQELSISATEFFSLLPDEVNTLLDELIEEEKSRQLRASQVTRKTANVSLTFDLAVELDTLGDIEDIKEVISQKVNDQLGLNVRTEIGSELFGDNYLYVKDTKFSGVEVVSVTDEMVL